MILVVFNLNIEATKRFLKRICF